MLVTESGQTVGTLSGGCLEADVSERARGVIATKVPRLIRYDTTSPDDIVWGLGMGCNGVVEVLIEPLGGKRAASDYMAFMEARLTCGEGGAVATVISERDAQLASRVWLGHRGECAGELNNQNLTRRVREDLSTALGRRRSEYKTYKLAGGTSVDAFIEIIEPPLPLVIFGAGHDAVPLVKFAQELGWETTVVDTRSRQTSREQFASADRVILTRPERIADDVRLVQQAAAVVMTHNYQHDLEVLRLLLASPLRYIGCLGSRRRTERMFTELIADGVVPHDAYLETLHAPIGLDIGAETPEEIALAIVAEIRAITAGRAGGKLRERAGAIHDHPAEGSTREVWAEALVGA